MAGVKGRSGGRRPGAGRKPKPKMVLPTHTGAAIEDSNEMEAPMAALSAQEMPVVAPVAAVQSQKNPDAELTPLDFLERTLRDPKIDVRTRVRAAIAAAQYRHTKTSDGGKKDAKQDAANKIAGSRFAPAAPPRLSLVK